MLPFFTNPYPDELLYSAIARYHFYSGNLDCKDTLEELFGSRSVIPSVEIGSYLSVLAENLGNQYSVEMILNKHTVYPFYAAFLSEQRQKEILEDVKGMGQALYTRLGMVAGSICRKAALNYCAVCAKLDIERYGEPYIHREHQLQGIDYCPHHEVPLRSYPNIENSRIEYVRFEEKWMNFSSLYEVDAFKEISVRLAKQAYKLLQLPLNTLCREEVRLKYRTLLRERNLITTSNHIRQDELYKSIMSYFPKGYLEKYESMINPNDEYSWLKVITRNVKRHVHPFRHLLLLDYLEQDIDGFREVVVDAGPFGIGPYPCLNRAAPHYKEFVIASVEVTRDYKTNAPIGTFSCSCGFIYARKGPNNSLNDKFKIGRTKAFGDTWMRRLNELSSQNLSTKAIAKELGVDSKTVEKYRSNDINISKKFVEKGNELEVKYKQDIIQAISTLPNMSRTELREKYKKQYAYLYRHDKTWLMNSLPAKKINSQTVNHVDWNERDIEYVNKINELHIQLLSQAKPIRITKSMIGRKLGILTNLELHLDKMPKTRKLLNEITETVQQFQLRRCYKVIDEIMARQGEVLLWKVQRIAAIKSHHFHMLKPIIEQYVQHKQNVINDEQTIG